MPSASGRRKSASSIVADNERGRQELKVDASTLAVAVPTGAGGLLKSSPFTMGTHRWRICYYPNGDCMDTAGHVSIFLDLDEDVAAPVTAQFRLSVVAEKRPLFFISWRMEVLSNPQIMHEFSSRALRGYSTFAKRGELAKRVRHRKVDNFTINCDIVVLNGFRTEEAMAPNKARIPPSDLHKHLGDLLQTGRGADVVFEVAGERFTKHRCVIGAQSPVISAELLGTGGEEGSGGGADAGVVLVDGVEPRAFKALLRFAYTDALPEVDKEAAVDGLHRDLLVTADRYGLERLKLICEDKLCKSIDVGTVETTLALAEKLHSHVLKEACLEFLSTPANLRAVMATRGQ